MPVAASMLRTRIQIQHPVRTRDAHGATVTTYTAESERWCKIETVGGREIFEAGRVDSDVTHSVTMRRYEGLTAKHRLVVLRGLLENMTLNVRVVLNPPDRNEPTTALCVEDT